MPRAGRGVIGVEVLVERCAGLDVGKADLKACVRVPGPRGGRRQQIKTFVTTTGSLLRLRDWLMEQQVTVVGMEATGDYWKPVYYVLEDAVEVQLLNAAHMHNGLPVRRFRTLTSPESRTGKALSITYTPNTPHDLEEFGLARGFRRR
jgi:transposase